MRASGESSTTKHRLLHASGPHPIPPPNDPKWVGKRVKVRRLSCRVSMTFRVVRTNQYNQDLGLIHSTNGNHLESPNEGSSIDHQVTIHLHAQNITIFPINETWYFTSQMLVSSSGGLILILTAQSTRNDYTAHRMSVSSLLLALRAYIVARGWDRGWVGPGGGPSGHGRPEQESRWLFICFLETGATPPKRANEQYSLRREIQHDEPLGSQGLNGAGDDMTLSILSRLTLTPYERASVDMLSGITRMLERQSERSGKSHEKDVAERFCK
ncbi:hypothetical protein F511_40358 [Dorcoceras hygrometricum]|uniref:Uncharacterized protein n=1 Tax=Dorcoceras hygrometricum TaxID=472368 RepID=A0A2Z7BJC9_9LAMI|nr:hypothetical protein F511_40358 [Dorcoceras hygrometricum]